MINCQICEHNPTGERCELFGRVIGMHGCSSGVERKPRNHFEEIKAMGVEEMAEFIAETVDCCNCKHPRNGCSENDETCAACWLDWLKEEI